MDYLVQYSTVLTLILEPRHRDKIISAYLHIAPCPIIINKQFFVGKLNGGSVACLTPHQFVHNRGIGGRYCYLLLCLVAVAPDGQFFFLVPLMIPHHVSTLEYV